MKSFGPLLIGALCTLGAVAVPVFKEVVVTDVEVTVITVTITETPAPPPPPPTTTTSTSSVKTTTTTVIKAAAAEIEHSSPSPPPPPPPPRPTVVSSSSSSFSSSSTTSFSTLISIVVPPPTSVPTSKPTSTSTSTSSAASSSTGSSYNDLLINSHNVHRSNHSASALTWDDTLAESALALANTCDYHHDTSLGPASNYGQNIGFGVSADQIDQMITNMMYNDEMMNYADLYGQANPSMTDFDSWGHFSQIVWVDTTKVGCATVTCSPLAESDSSDSLPFTVCNYSPAGNVAGEYASNVLPPRGLSLLVAE